jgi:hypothetical protein
MGNCQAAEAATVVVQHPGGRVQRLYWATSAAEVMRANPGHYVALVTHRADAADDEKRSQQQQHRHGAARVTRVKLLKPRDTLVLGQAYRLITVAEVTKALQAKKEEKTRRAQQHLVVQPKHAGGRTGSGDDSQPQQVVDDSLDQVLLLLCDHHPLVACCIISPSLLCFLVHPSSVLEHYSTNRISTSMDLISDVLSVSIHSYSSISPIVRTTCPKHCPAKRLTVSLPA